MKRLEIFFPPFDSIVCDPKLETFFSYAKKYAKKIEPGKINVAGYSVIIEKYMPPHSALFLHNKNIVAVYKDGKLVFDKIKIKKLEILFAEFLKCNMKGKENERP